MGLFDEHCLSEWYDRKAAWNFPSGRRYMGYHVPKIQIKCLIQKSTSRNGFTQVSKKKWFYMSRYKNA
jgi:hypothetical protein